MKSFNLAAAVAAASSLPHVICASSAQGLACAPLGYGLEIQSGTAHVSLGTGGMGLIGPEGLRGVFSATV